MILRTGICRCIIIALFFLVTAPQCDGQRAVGNSCDFVVPFPASGFANDMTVYLCTDSRPANVTVTIYIDASVTEQLYHIPANSSLKLPRISPDIMLPREEPGRDYAYKRSVSIHSDVPVSAYAHYPKEHASGGTNLIPVRSWGYAYNILDVPYDLSPGITITAAYDNTRIEIVPVRNTAPFHAAGQPYTITLNRNETFQVRLEDRADAKGVREMTGSTVRSIPNDSGLIYPVGVMVNSLRSVLKHGDYEGGSADFEVEQLSATCRWGKAYITAPYRQTDTQGRDTALYTLYRIMVQDPLTVVKRNGVALGGLVAGKYYEYVTNKTAYIEADAPVMMVQCMLTPDKDDPEYPLDYAGDGEMTLLSPVEDTGRHAEFYLPADDSVHYNYISLIVPAVGLASLTIDGSSSFSAVYPHSVRPDYKVVLKRLDAPQARYCSVACDTFFTGLTWGLPLQGTLAAQSIACNINPSTYTGGEAMITGKGDAGRMKNYTCTGDSFRFVIKTEYQPEQITWLLKGHAGLTAGENVIWKQPVADSVVISNGHTYRYFSLPAYYIFQKAGVFAVPVIVKSTMAPYCGNTQTYIAEIKVLVSPVADFAYTVAACIPFAARLKAVQVPGDTGVITSWRWDIAGVVAFAESIEHTWITDGEKEVYLQVTGRNGCSSDTVRLLRLKEAVKPVAAFDLPEMVCLPYDSARFVNKSVYKGTASGGLTWHWDFGDASGHSETKDVSHLYSSAQTYSITLVASASDGCSDTAVLELANIALRPTAAFDQSATKLCVGDDFTLTDKSVASAGSTNARWFWLPGDGRGWIESRNFSGRYNHPGLPFTISHYVISSEGCRSDTVVAEMNVYDTPAADAGPDKEIVEGSRVQLEGTVTGAGSIVIAWSPPTGLNATDILRPLAGPVSDQWYYLSATSGICDSRDSVLVKVLPDLNVPNVFTPNNDGIHDHWEIAGLNSYGSAVVLVNNRWGQKVYESKGYSVPWDGTSMGKPVPAGTYYYIIRTDSGRKGRSGFVMIVR